MNRSARLLYVQRLARALRNPIEAWRWPLLEVARWFRKAPKITPPTGQEEEKAGYLGRRRPFDGLPLFRFLTLGRAIECVNRQR